LAVLAHDADAVARLARDPSLLNARGGEDDATALMLAAEEGHLALVEALLGHGAEVNSAVRDAADGDLDGATALMWASENGFPEVAAALLGAGARVNARTRSGQTALMWACEDGHEAVVALLCPPGALTCARRAGRMGTRPCTRLRAWGTRALPGRCCTRARRTRGRRGARGAATTRPCAPRCCGSWR
jgi:hypothetical protein